MQDKLKVGITTAQGKEKKESLILSCNMNILERCKRSEVLETTTMIQAIS